MSKYIEADKLAESLEAIAHSDLRPDSYFSGGFREGLRKAAHMLREEPSADVAPVVHAKWVSMERPHSAKDVRKCSNCGVVVTPYAFWHYCPACGAKMDVEVECND